MEIVTTTRASRNVFQGSLACRQPWQALNPMASPPSAPRRPHVISAHGDDREDPWFWLREREDPEVLAYLEAENAYTEEATAPLADFRGGLFEEMKARIKETDMSVPTRRGPWWYYSRTEEGKDYGIHCRRPARSLQELPPAGEPGEEEQILLDENVLAEGTDYFAVGSAAVSHDHRWLAFSTDHRGNEKYELQFRPLDAGIPAATESVPDTGYGLAWSADGRLRLLRPHGRGPAALPALAPPAGQRPRPATCSSSRSPTGASRSGPARPGTPRGCSSACTAPTPPSGSPSPRPTRWPSPVSSCRAGKAWSTPSTTSRPPTTTAPPAAAAGSSS